MIPESVISIGNGTFRQCEDLTNVYYKGSLTQWQTITIGNNNAALTDATRYYFSDEAPTAEEWAQSENWWHYDADGEIVIWKKSDAVS